MPNQPLHAVLFDMDGTITKPILDFGAIRAAIGTKEGMPLLEYLEQVDEEEQARGHALLEKFEDDAARQAEFNSGVPELLAFLEQAGIATGIVTRNSRVSLETTFERLGIQVGASVTREDAPVKPSPEPVLLAAKLLGMDPQYCLFVGDYVFDIQAGIAAGMRTALIASKPMPPSAPQPDYDVRNAADLIPVIARLNGIDPRL